MQLNEMVKFAHGMAVEKGWWESGDRNPLEIAALIHSEVSEFVEEARVGSPPVYVTNYEGKKAPIEVLSPESFVMTNGDKQTPIKPEGQLIELADVVIRVMDYAGRMGWDLEAAIKAKMDYNATRPHRHGGKLA